MSTLLADINRQHAGRWDTWTVWYENPHPTIWCTRPAGTSTAVHEETTGERMEAFLAQVTALQDNGVTFQFHPSGTIATATATWTSHDGTPATYGPAPVPLAIHHAQTALRNPGPAMTTSPASPRHAQLITTWQASGKRYQAIAAAIATWAATQQPGTAVPGNDHFSGNLDFTASPETYRRARVFLATNGILKATGTRTYQVA